MANNTSPYKNSARDERLRRDHRRATQKKGSAVGRMFRTFVLTILFVLLVFILAFSATFYARSRGWLKGKAPADPAVIRRMFQSL